MTAAEKKAEARAAIIAARSNFATSDDMDAAIDAFERACVAEALEPRETSPQLAEAEESLRLCVQSLEWRRPELYLNRKHCKPIADELDRLRAEVARLKSATKEEG